MVRDDQEAGRIGKLASDNSFPAGARGNRRSPMCALGLTRRDHPRRHGGEPVEPRLKSLPEHLALIGNGPVAKF